MVGGPSVALSRDIQTLFDAGTVAGFSDRQLLERLAQARDGSSEAAFEVLVRRHGPMVLRVCRNVLRDWNDAEDAFQATFIILARRWGSIRGRDSVESWLFGVACRVSARAQVQAARRRTVERRGAAQAHAASGHSTEVDPAPGELSPIVQEEVRRLPEKYRAAVVLCYWDGLTHEQAATQLGVPLGTVRSRIARARELLRKRLTRRGVAPLAGLPAVATPAAAPDSWVVATLRAVFPSSARGGLATSPSVAALVQDVLWRMSIMKLKMTATGLLLLATATAGVILAAPQARTNRPAAAPARGSRAVRDGNQADVSHTRAKVQPPLQSLGDYVVEPPDVLLFEVLEALPGRPIAGERLVRPDGKISLGFYGDVYVAGLTISEVKEKIVQHLRKYLNDEVLGLREIDPETGEPRRDKDGRAILTKDLKDCDRVFVDVTAYNSKNYYVLGEVHSPGRFPVTGHDTVLDALSYAEGLTPAADRNGVVLYRPEKGMLKRMAIDVTGITVGDDQSTNYQLLPNDRLAIPGKAGEDEADDVTLTVRPAVKSPNSRGAIAPDRPRAVVPDQPPRKVAAPRRRDAADDDQAIFRLQRRMDEVERKLDRILELLERREEE